MNFPFSKQEIKAISFKPAFVLIMVPFCLTGAHFLSASSIFEQYQQLFYVLGLQDLYDKLQFLLTESELKQFYQLLYWAFHLLVFYVGIPFLSIRFLLKERIKDYGLKFKGMFSYYQYYLLAFVLIFPIVLIASYSSAFQITYPFFVPLDKADIVPYFVIWEFAYILQFFALEFFFRGFIVQGLKTQMGIYSVFVMVVPYCMIHFSKPLPECIGSIFAGVFLGLMSYRTNSVWLGAFLHVGVAVSMDLLSLWHKGYF